MGDWLIDIFDGWVNGLLDFIFGYVNGFFGKANTVIGLSQVNSAMGIVNGIASSVLVLLMMKQILTIHILETDGDPDQSPLKIVEKGCIALAFINLQSYVLNKLLGLAAVMCDTIINSMDISFVGISDIINTIKSVTVNVFIILLFSIAYAVGFSMFLWKSLKRSAELALMKILFPLFACDAATVSMERIRAFISSYLTVIFGYIVQIVLFKLSMLMIFEGDMWLSLAFIFSAANAPKWLEKYTYSTGTARGVSNAARSATYMIPQIIRMVK